MPGWGPGARQGVAAGMKDLLFDQFQATVDELLIRHRSILDVLSKLQESGSRTGRAVTKAVTTCGCIRINADKQQFPEDVSLHNLRDYMNSHVEGQLCEHCKEILEAEMGAFLFYIAGLCNTLGLSLYDVMLKEHKKLGALGVFNIS